LDGRKLVDHVAPKSIDFRITDLLSVKDLPTAKASAFSEKHIPSIK